ncbi:MAG TPA: hypothetical protein VFI31_05320 [Pirellulales bacterium]|nr:hypothetical protein [Pirellulales bacterium]
MTETTTAGVLEEGSADTHGSSGVQSFAVANGGQNIFWQTTNGNLYESTNGSPDLSPDGPATQFVDSGVLSDAYPATATAVTAQFMLSVGGARLHKSAPTNVAVPTVVVAAQLDQACYSPEYKHRARAVKCPPELSRALLRRVRPSREGR